MDGATALALAVPVIVAWYVINCLIWPFANCLRCRGAGRFRSPSGRAWRPCRRCGGTGSRVRIGRRLWHWLRSDR